MLGLLLAIPAPGAEVHTLASCRRDSGETGSDLDSPSAA